jgi:hypothetical protein
MSHFSEVKTKWDTRQLFSDIAMDVSLPRSLLLLLRRPLPLKLRRKADPNRPWSRN